MTVDDTEHITIENWFTEARSAIDYASSVGWSDFAGRYEVIIRAAEAQLGLINDRLNRLIQEPKHMRQHEFLTKYVDAMSVTVDGNEVFLPSFSDQCLLETMNRSSAGLSPFRGLYYSWKLSEAAALFQHPRKTPAAFKYLTRLLNDSLQRDYTRQSSGTEYHGYETALRENQGDTAWTAPIEHT